MNRIHALLDRLAELDLRLAVAAFVIFVIAVAVLPYRYYLGAAIALAVTWLNVGRFTELGAIAAFAKATFLIPLLIVWLMATLHSAPRRNAPWVSWVYVVTPILAMLSIMLAQDALQVLAYNLCFLASALAAIQVVRCITTRESMQYVFISYGIGLIVPLIIVLYALVEGGPKHYQLAYGFRFSPFGAGSNQSTPLLLQLVFTGMYLFHSIDRPILRLAPLLIAGVAAAVSLKTGSRQAFVMLAIFAVPYILTVVRRPVYLLLFGLIGVGAFVWIFMLGGEEAQVQLHRATDLSYTASRDTIALKYLEIIAESPAIGIMGQTQSFAIAHPDAGTHPHNSYLEMLYWGGLMLGTPLIAAAFYSLWASFMVVLRRKRIAQAPEGMVVLASALLAILFHGGVNTMIYTSVTSWPFFHFLLSGLMCAIYADLKAVKRLRNFAQ